MTIKEAVSNGDITTLRRLLEAGGDPNEPEDDDYWPPLIEACYHDNEEAARILLDAGADIYGPNSGGETPFLMAIQQGCTRVFELLVERGCRLNTEMNKAPWMITRAGGLGNLRMLQWLLAQGLAPDLADDSGCTALIFAAKHDHLETIKALLAAGADPNHADEDSETVLMWASDHPGHAEVLRVLLSAGADVNAKNDIGGTALSWAVNYGDIEMIQILLDAWADVNSSQTLTHAAYHGRTSVVRLLLESGADPNVRQPNGETAFDNAKARNRREVMNLLLQAIEDRRLGDSGRTYPNPHFSIGTQVRTLKGTPRIGWIIRREWNDKYGKYGYKIEIEATSQPRKTVSTRYWEEELREAALTLS